MSDTPAHHMDTGSRLFCQACKQWCYPRLLPAAHCDCCRGEA